MQYYTPDGSIDYLLHKVQGDIQRALSYTRIRITRVASVGDETDFRWLINGVKHRVRVGDYLLFSGTDLRMPLITRRPSGVMIEIMSFDPVAVVSSPELISCFFANPQPVITGAAARSLDGDFERLKAELERSDSRKTAASRAALMLLLVSINRHYGFESDKHVSQSIRELGGKIVAYIGEHFHEKLTIGAVAREFGISESSLSKLMRRSLDLTFPEYVRRVRVNNVIKLITVEGKSVLSAASESGFTSVAGFYKTFREISGMTPTDFINAEK